MKKYEIDDNFIGVFDNYIPEEHVDAWIAQYHAVEKEGFTYTRQVENLNYDKHFIDDTSADLSEAKFYTNQYTETKSFNLQGTGRFFNTVFWDEIYPLYKQRFSVLNTLGKHGGIFSLKLQKTEPGQGYHVWHSEAVNKDTRERVLVVMAYLNDVQEGGETEFLYQKKRVKPVRNRIVVWPSGFTHTHRGNPPLSNAKYVITGWVEWIE